jgi:hypothetical protein
MAHGLTSRTKAYRVAYASLPPLVRLIGVALFSERTTTTGRLGRAMLNAARAPDRFPKGALEARDIHAARASFQMR